MITFQQKNRVISTMLITLVVLLAISILLVETLSAETRYRVKSSDNLNTIVERFYPNSELSRGQLLVGILIQNPRAFKGGNINFLLRGKRLTLPEESDLQKISPESASELLSEHARFFRFGIAGNLPTPTFSEMEGEPEELNESDEILAKQKIQTKKIDQLQYESNELKKQLEELLNEKTNRDQRLLDLEESLKESLNIEKQETPVVESVELENELADSSEPSRDLEKKVENAQEIMDGENTLKERGDKITIEPSASILSKLAWLIPLILLGLFLVYIFGKKKQMPQADEAIKINKAGYIESYDDSVVDLQDQDSGGEATELEESSLETSVKLDVARAYIEAEDTQSALDILTEIMEEGSDEQRQQAHDLLETILPS